MRADLTAAGDHDGLNVLIYAAIPLTCGQAIDVPDIILKGTTLLSPSTSVIEATGDHAARIFTPGAVRSGCNK